MRLNTFVPGFVAGVLVGLIIMAFSAANSFMLVQDKLTMYIDMNNAKLRQLAQLRRINQQLEAADTYEFMQEQRIVNLAESKKMAEAFTSFDGEVTQYRNEELGFTMSYPASWGELNISIQTPESSEWVREGKILRAGFTHQEISFGAYSADYEDNGRGFSTAESIFATSNPEAGNPAMDQAKPDNIRVLKSGEKVYTWYAWDVGWETGETRFGIKVPLLHPDIPAMGIAGPISNDVLSEEEIAGFLEMARTFELIK